MQKRSYFNSEFSYSNIIESLVDAHKDLDVLVKKDRSFFDSNNGDSLHGSYEVYAYSIKDLELKLQNPDEHEGMMVANGIYFAKFSPQNVSKADLNVFQVFDFENGEKLWSDWELFFLMNPKFDAFKFMNADWPCCYVIHKLSKFSSTYTLHVGDFCRNWRNWRSDRVDLNLPPRSFLKIDHQLGENVRNWDLKFETKIRQAFLKPDNYDAILISCNIYNDVVWDDVLARDIAEGIAKSSFLEEVSLRFKKNRHMKIILDAISFNKTLVLANLKLNVRAKDDIKHKIQQIQQEKFWLILNFEDCKKYEEESE